MAGLQSQDVAKRPQGKRKSRKRRRGQGQTKGPSGKTAQRGGYGDAALNIE